MKFCCALMKVNTNETHSQKKPYTNFLSKGDIPMYNTLEIDVHGWMLVKKSACVFI